MSEYVLRFEALHPEPADRRSPRRMTLRLERDQTPERVVEAVVPNVQVAMLVPGPRFTEAHFWRAVALDVSDLAEADVRAGASAGRPARDATTWVRPTVIGAVRDAPVQLDRELVPGEEVTRFRVP
jgi:hypothetical protein